MSRKAIKNKERMKLRVRRAKAGTAKRANPRAKPPSLHGSKVFVD